jgi:hypothetical protein
MWQANRAELLMVLGSGLLNGWLLPEGAAIEFAPENAAPAAHVRPPPDA